MLQNDDISGVSGNITMLIDELMSTRDDEIIINKIQSVETNSSKNANRSTFSYQIHLYWKTCPNLSFSKWNISFLNSLYLYDVTFFQEKKYRNPYFFDFSSNWYSFVSTAGRITYHVERALKETLHEVFHPRRSSCYWSIGTHPVQDVWSILRCACQDDTQPHKQFLYSIYLHKIETTTLRYNYCASEGNKQFTWLRNYVIEQFFKIYNIFHHVLHWKIYHFVIIYRDWHTPH